MRPTALDVLFDKGLPYKCSVDHQHAVIPATIPPNVLVSSGVKPHSTFAFTGDFTYAFTFRLRTPGRVGVYFQLGHVVRTHMQAINIHTAEITLTHAQTRGSVQRVP